ncbi:choice-of-anchor I family protein [Corynebacterium comes]|uniref:Choice-of-anchor I domain-containing protein n=1 Tax=Corynebacterium comes TaxID=2675218 RepID=A0A6B8W520_9CORY|nr:choice-of-anchor I family protein [Corynebacterium comes]QGU04980.1 hypothetical protein CETAM_08630 [Corynebacterium comes]
MFFRRTAVSLCAAVATGLSIAPAHAAVVAEPITHSAPGAALSVTPIGSYESGIFDASAAEIVAYHAASERVLTVNARSGSIDLLDIADPTSPQKVGEVSGGAGTTINSVAVRADGLAVATVEPTTKTDPGRVIFFDAAGNGSVLGSLPVGALPDMVAITGDGRYALVANEGEPAEDYSIDPEGSVSVITLPEGVRAATEVRTADFHNYNAPGALPEGVRIFGQIGDSETVAQNLEPEYVTISGDKAYVSLQENNAIAVVDIRTATVEDIFPLGTVDLGDVPMDISDKDGGINIANWPIKSFRLPDAIESYSAGGATYIVTANEGDARDWDGYSEESRLKGLGRNGVAPICEGYVDDIAELQKDENAGRLNITLAEGLNGDGTCYEQIYSYGGRGFSIFDHTGNLVFNSDDSFEKILAEAVPEYFNSNHSESNLEGRSDDKGPEPEGVALGEIDGRTYAFIGLERIGGVMVYDISDPSAATFVTYVNNRDFSVSMEDEADQAAALPKAGDLGPEGLVFIPATDSPNGKNLLVVGNEVSGTTTIFRIDDLPGGGFSRPEVSSLSSR